ncbi:DUF4179 domain-containing protein [Anaerosporobacter faecicola]|uniref:DUF4179 domain-containing protein n=1 Tax=Anaerosporobacter faecicola TaxID=2718714 RepID=UPI00143AC646|nr:DUF4179 domain-containing protein [Anaerosporobacter faecicola]
MNKKLDDILFESLKPSDEPDSELNRQILNRRSMEIMKYKKIKKTAVVAASLCMIVAGSVTAYAAYRYLNPSQIATEVSGNDALAKAFQSKDAIQINETQQSGKYKITLLGIVSGSDLSPYVESEVAGELQDEQTYATLAIACMDGSPMEYENKCVSPLINGVDWMIANNGTLNAGLHWFEKDGVIYELLECTNLEIFADRGVQIGVVDSFGQENKAFTMDEKTGVYSKTADYEGTNALFQLPLDVSKADPVAADAFIEELEKSQSSGEEDIEQEDALTKEDTEQEDLVLGEKTDAMDKENWDLDAFMKQIEEVTDAEAFLRDYAVAIPDTKEILTVDEDGCVTYGKPGESGGTVSVENNKVGVRIISSLGSDGTRKGTQIDTFLLNEDGTVTYEAYMPAENE